MAKSQHDSGAKASAESEASDDFEVEVHPALSKDKRKKRNRFTLQIIGSDDGDPESLA